MDVERNEDLRESGQMKATNDVNEDGVSTVSLSHDQIFDLAPDENLSYLNSSVASDCDIVSTCDDLECNDKTIQEEDSEDSEATIREEVPLNDNKRMTSSLNDLTELSESAGSVDSTYEKVCRMKHRGKSIDSGISLNSVNVEDNDDRIVIADGQCVDDARRKAAAFEDSDVENVEGAERNEENVITCPVNDANLQTELNTTVSAVDSNDCRTIGNEDYLEDDIDRLKYDDEENVERTTSTDVENVEGDDSIEKTIAEIREMNEIIKNVLCTTNDDEQRNLAEERMVETLTTKMENDHDEVMRKIIESCTKVSTGFQQEPMIDESSSADPTKDPSLMTFRGGTFLPHRRTVSDTDIAKEDILKTIQEAEKILTDSPYWNSPGETNAAESRDGDDEEREKRSNEGGSGSFVAEQHEDAAMNTINTMGNEEIFFLDPDIVESNLQRLTELTYLDRPKSQFEIHETLEKIAEEKRKIEDQKRESLETLSRKFDEINKFIEDEHDLDAACASDKDHCGLKASNDITDSDSDSFDEFQVNRANIELPLTKTEITENLKIEELEKELADEIEKHKQLMDEYQSIIAADIDTTPEAILESMQANHEDTEDTDKNIQASECKNDDDKADDKAANETSEKMDDATTIKGDLDDFDDFFREEFKESERTYIKGKVYDFDEKKHGVR